MTVLALAVMAGFAGEAFAFGPATHLELSRQILLNLQLVPEAVSALLSAHPFDFYYGSIAADIVVGKKMAPYLNHCHRWSVGYEVAEEAKTPSQSAFALGYMSHLAADVVAHNYFVPYKIILGFTARANTHQLWEMRLDSHAPPEVWEIPRQITRERHVENDELLKRVLSRQLFSFGTNKTLFQGMVLLGRSGNWHSLVQRATKRAQPDLHPERIAHYRELAFDSCLSLLSGDRSAPCLIADPTGEGALMAASEIARRLRKNYRTGKLTGDGLLRVCQRFRPRLEASVFGKESYDQLLLAGIEIIESEKAVRD